MLKNLRLANMVVVNENHTDLSTTDFFIKNVKNAIGKKAKFVREQFEKGEIGEGTTMLRLNRSTSLLIRTDRKFPENPQFFAYDNRTGEVSFVMDYEDFRCLLNEGSLEMLEERIETIGEKDFGRFLKPGVAEKMGGLVSSFSENRAEHRVSFDEDFEEDEMLAM